MLCLSCSMPLDITSKRFTLVIHFIFWAIYFLLNGTSYTKFVQLDDVAIKLLITGTIHMGVVYINLLILLPLFFFKQKFRTYLAIMIPLFFGTIATILLVENNWYTEHGNFLDFIEPGYFKPDRIINAFMSTFLVLAMTALLKFLQEWYLQQDQVRKLAYNQLKAEHKMLRMQVSPHFLFNALNNIYSLAYTKSDNTGPSILRLADLMRYQLYDSEEKKVSLEKEAEYIDNYIGLQELKIDDWEDKITYTKGDLSGIDIEPLLFIPFVENAFKHGNLDEDDSYLKITLYAEGKIIRFVLENSLNPANQRKDDVGGVGIENVKNRLAVYYPTDHSLELKNDGNIYSVKLSIRTT